MPVGPRKAARGIASFRKAIAIKPNHPEALCNLGSAMRDLGRLEESLDCYNQALANNPNFAGAHNNRGNALRDLGQLDKAIASFQRAVSANPRYAEAYNNLGNTFRDVGQSEPAIECFRAAINIKPDLAEAHSNLGNVFSDIGRAKEAFASHRQAVTLDQQNDTFWSAFADSLRRNPFHVDDPAMWDLLLAVLNHPTVRPSTVAQPVLAALHNYGGLSQLLEELDLSRPIDAAVCNDVIERLSSLPLLLRLMHICPISDLEIEALLTKIRRGLLDEAAAGRADDRCMPFKVALAMQCFTNEYVYSETEEEKAALAQIEQETVAALDGNQPVSNPVLTIIAAYRPLYRLPWTKALCGEASTPEIQALVLRMITEPERERVLRSNIKAATRIKHDTSQAVREQYEENPYPRWIRAGTSAKAGRIGTVLRAAPFRFDLGDYESPKKPEILVAGCGTGQQAIEAAAKFANCRVLAIDLSLSSLSYGMRKTQDLNVANIEFAQADILELGELDRRFDLIECVGVLHHLSDPLAGWQVLVNLLQPGGIMKIGLYSEIARQDVIAGRGLIAERGYTAKPDDIRKCRQEIGALAKNGNPDAQRLCVSGDFFSLSECRDLLFYVQEHRFTLPEVNAALNSLALQFLGFGFAVPTVPMRFMARHPEKGDMVDLSKWHAFELDNPDTFAGMYHFWCRKGGYTPSKSVTV